MTSSISPLDSDQTDRPPPLPPKEPASPAPSIPNKSIRRQGQCHMRGEADHTVSVRIKNLEEENARLRAELVYSHEVSKLGDKLCDQAQECLDNVKDALLQFRQDQKQADRSFIERTLF